MPFRLRSLPALRFAALLCLVCVPLLLTGCAFKEGGRPRAPRFPEHPALTPALSPEHALGEAKNRRGGAAVSGGWGFARGDACVLAVPSGRRRRHYDSVPLERYLARLRNEVEFSRTPPVGRRFTVTDYGTVSRTLHTEEGRMYAIWRGRVGIAPERAPVPAAAGSARTVQREYWFDITQTSASNMEAAALSR